MLVKVEDIGLDVVAGLTAERNDDTDPLRYHPWLLILFLLESLMLFAFTSQTLDERMCVYVVIETRTMGIETRRE